MMEPGAGATMGGYRLTPVMRQYLEVKGAHEDAVLFFRMGDFYEMFFEDAERASSVLDIALTTRNRNDERPIPMCGIPCHSVRPYVARLLEAGIKVAICDQVEQPERGLARRKVTRVITPGTALDEESLVAEEPNYLAAAAESGGRIGLAWTEFSTGELRFTETGGMDEFSEELVGVGPSELVVTRDGQQTLGQRGCQLLGGVHLSLVDNQVLGRGGAGEAALGLLTGYLARTWPGHDGHLRPAQRYEVGSLMRIDAATRVNLELIEGARGGRQGSLLAVIDSSVTAMGGRLLHRWVSSPLADAAAIGRRLDGVEELVDGGELRRAVRELLGGVGDLERLCGRVGAGTASARDLAAVADSLGVVAELIGLLGRPELGAILGASLEELDSLPELRAGLVDALAAELPGVSARLGVIRDGYNDEVDRLRTISRDGKGWIAAFEKEERERTGIGTLKVGYNKVFGYYIEVARAAADRVPSDYERKQTLTNAERYATIELKQREAEVLGAEERLARLESHLFSELTATVLERVDALGRTATAVARIDALAGLAETAVRRGYVRPELASGGPMQISEGRHPVVEAAAGARFVPNDCCLGDDDGASLLVITGPNMAGKSTYLRQTALIGLMAHCGSFVPAAAARIPLLDRIFTRIGASDDLAGGRSTFMVEMTETATILANMTDRSLVVLDEIGRGTSTFDGISIAWAVAEAMVDAGVKTLFATHYHELAALAGVHERVANLSVAVRRYRGEIVFLYRVIEGAASGSYGIEVAKLAGLPDHVTGRARELLAGFEERAGEVDRDLASGQLGLFTAASGGGGELAGAARQLLAELAGTEVDRLTPLEALALLDTFVRAARQGQ